MQSMSYLAKATLALLGLLAIGPQAFAEEVKVTELLRSGYEVKAAYVAPGRITQIHFLILQKPRRSISAPPMRTARRCSATTTTPTPTPVRRSATGSCRTGRCPTPVSDRQKVSIADADRIPLFQG
ncbi:hypothetical protein [Pseudomonas sp. DP-17]|uniref:hypothetical protein n=1 Tax=Pseudomonas sp. DP-17 TaxID=1580486 RepID=UPI001EFBC90E|nr:hypothetical protein [Pseudomonas sp. DP-17]MCG8906748.1 hypothetical protein [Pseudomonas sp. DP-17]